MESVISRVQPNGPRFCSSVQGGRFDPLRRIGIVPGIANQSGGTEDCGYGICHTLSGNIGCGAVYWLGQGKLIALG